MSVFGRWRNRRNPFGIEIRARYRDAPPREEDRRLFFERQRLVGADFSERELDHFGALGSRFERCWFERTRIEDASFGAGREVSVYVDCVFDGARISSVAGGLARFVGCSFLDSELDEWFCLTTEFVNCVFSGRMRRSVIHGTVQATNRKWLDRSINEIRGNDFSGMDLVDVSFRSGVDLSMQRLPRDGYLYIPDAAAAFAEARRRVMEWEPSETRREALIFIEIHEEDVAEGQRQALLREGDSISLDAEAIRQVHDILRRFAAEPSN